MGVSNRKKEETKANIAIAVIMTLSFLAGMMLITIKYLIQEYVPIIAYINPVSLVTDGLYSLYYYTTHGRFFTNIVCLGVFIIIMNIITYFFIRRKKYDSI